MTTQIPTQSLDQIIYPERDGQPMSDNTIQFSWITSLKSNLDWLYAKDSLVFVAGDLLWYPLEGDNKTRQAPVDVDPPLVVLLAVGYSTLRETTSTFLCLQCDRGLLPQRE